MGERSEARHVPERSTAHGKRGRGARGGGKAGAERLPLFLCMGRGDGMRALPPSPRLRRTDGAQVTSPRRTTLLLGMAPGLGAMTHLPGGPLPPLEDTDGCPSRASGPALRLALSAGWVRRGLRLRRFGLWLGARPGRPGIRLFVGRRRACRDG